MEKLEVITKFVVFDLDGTLVDSADQIYRAFNSACEELSIQKLEKVEVASRIGLPAKELFSHLPLTQESLQLAISTFRKHLYRQELQESDLFADVMNFLELLTKNGLQLAVATNKPETLAKKALSDCGIIRYFETIVGADPLPPKPNPALLSTCQNFLGALASQTVMVGDRIEDVEAAKLAGMRSYGVAQGTHTNEALLASGATEVFSSISEMYRLTKKGWQFEKL